MTFINWFIGFFFTGFSCTPSPHRSSGVFFFRFQFSFDVFWPFGFCFDAASSAFWGTTLLVLTFTKFFSSQYFRVFGIQCKTLFRFARFRVHVFNDFNDRKLPEAHFSVISWPTIMKWVSRTDFINFLHDCPSNVVVQQWLINGKEKTMEQRRSRPEFVFFLETPLVAIRGKISGRRKRRRPLVAIKFFLEQHSKWPRCGLISTKLSTNNFHPFDFLSSNLKIPRIIKTHSLPIRFQFLLLSSFQTTKWKGIHQIPRELNVFIHFKNCLPYSIVLEQFTTCFTLFLQSWINVFESLFSISQPRLGEHRWTSMPLSSICLSWKCRNFISLVSCIANVTAFQSSKKKLEKKWWRWCSSAFLVPKNQRELSDKIECNGPILIELQTQREFKRWYLKKLQVCHFLLRFRFVFLLFFFVFFLRCFEDDGGKRTRSGAGTCGGSGPNLCAGRTLASNCSAALPPSSS